MAMGRSFFGTQLKAHKTINPYLRIARMPILRCSSLAGVGATPAAHIPWGRRWNARRAFRPMVQSAATEPAWIERSQPRNDPEDTALLGVVIVENGSRPDSPVLAHLSSFYRQSSPGRIVEVAHLDETGGHLQQALRGCAQRGATRIVVVPYFLTTNRQAQEEIPFLVAEALQDLPGVKCVVAEPIGMGGLMAEFIEHRVKPFERSGNQVAERGWDAAAHQQLSKESRQRRQQQQQQQIMGPLGVQEVQEQMAAEHSGMHVADQVQQWEQRAGEAEASADATRTAAGVVVEMEMPAVELESPIIQLESPVMLVEGVWDPTKAADITVVVVEEEEETPEVDRQAASQGDKSRAPNVPGLDAGRLLQFAAGAAAAFGKLVFLGTAGLIAAFTFLGSNSRSKYDPMTDLRATLSQTPTRPAGKRSKYDPWAALLEAFGVPPRQ